MSLDVVPLSVRFKDPDPAVKEADVIAVTRAVIAREPWLSHKIDVHVVSGGITNLLFRVECEGEVRPRHPSACTFYTV